MSSKITFSINNPLLQQQEQLYQERISSIGTDRFDVALGSHSNHPSPSRSMREEEHAARSATHRLWDDFRPTDSVDDDDEDDDDYSMRLAVEGGDERMPDYDLPEEELLIYSDVYQADSNFDDYEREYVQSLTIPHEDREHAKYRLKEDAKDSELEGSWGSIGGGSDSGSDDFIHEGYLEHRGNEESGRVFSLQDRVAVSAIGVQEGEQQDVPSSSSGWESIRSDSECEVFQPRQRHQQDYCCDHQDDEDGDEDVPDLEEDMLDDMLFELPGLPESTHDVTPSNPFESAQYDPSPSMAAFSPSTATTSTKRAPKFMVTTERSRYWVLEKLESMACQFLHDLSIGNQPAVQLAYRDRADVIVYDEGVGVIRRRAAYSGHGERTLDELAVVELQQEAEEGVIPEDEEREMSSLSASNGKRRRTEDESELKPRRRMRRDGMSSGTISAREKNGDGKQDQEAAVTHNLHASTPSLPSPVKHLEYAYSSDLFTKHLPFWTKRASRVLRAIELIHENLSKDIVSSKRDVFYRDVLTFGSQLTVDSIVEDLACTLETPRECLNVVAGSRSVVFGSVRMLVKVPGKSMNGSNGEQSEREIGGGVASEGGGGEGPNWLQKDIANSLFAKTLQTSLSQSYKPKHDNDKDKSMRSEYEAERGNVDSLESRVFQTSYNTLVLIPVQFRDIEEIEIHPRTRLVLVIEKEATFTNLISLGFCETHGPCILLTSKGFPDQVARRLLRVLSDMVYEGVFVKKFNRSSSGTGSGVGNGNGMGEPLLAKVSNSSWSSSLNPVRIPRPLDIPLLALVDCDPHGIGIYLTYRCGSVLSAYDNANLAVPELKCLGQVPSDWDVFLNRCSLPSTVPGVASPSQGGVLQEKEKAAATNQETALVMSKSENEEDEESEPLRSWFLGTFIPLTERDRRKLERLLTEHPYIRQHARWKAQIRRMLEVNSKTELQSLHLCSGSTDSKDESEIEGSVGIEKEQDEDGYKGGEEWQVLSSSSSLVSYLQRKLQDPGSWL
ncbi:endodeoxyribonuclease [Linnemannia zychae]|nr:endodeoxyribonuclease [Linnemannia zychae]